MSLSPELSLLSDAIAAERYGLHVRRPLGGVLQAALTFASRRSSPPTLFTPISVIGRGKGAGIVISCDTKTLGTVALKCAWPSSEDPSPYVEELVVLERLRRSSSWIYPPNVINLLSYASFYPSSEIRALLLRDSKSETVRSLLSESPGSKMRVGVTALLRGGTVGSYLGVARAHAARTGKKGVAWVVVLSLLRGIADGVADLRQRGMVRLEGSVEGVLVDVDTAEGCVEWDSPSSLPCSLPRAVIHRLSNVVNMRRSIRTSEDSSSGSGVGGGGGGGGEGVESEAEGFLAYYATVGEAREDGWKCAADVDGSYEWTRNCNGPLDILAPESRDEEVEGKKVRNLKRQSSFELGVLFYRLLLSSHPYPAYEKDVRAASTQPPPILTPSTCGIEVDCDEARKEFTVVAEVARGLVNPDPALRTTVEEARSVLWWAYGRVLMREHEERGERSLGDATLEDLLFLLHQGNGEAEGGMEEGEEEEVEEDEGEGDALVGNLRDAMDAADEVVRRRREDARREETMRATCGLKVPVARIQQILQALKKHEKSDHGPALAQVLWVLSRNTENCLSIVAEGGVDILIQAVREELSLECRGTAAAALRNVIAEHAGARDEARKAIPSLLQLAQCDNPVLRAHAAGALLNLCIQNISNRVALRDAGGISVLVENVREGSDEGRTDAALALQLLAEDGRACAAVSAAGGITALVQLLRDGSEEGKGAASLAIRDLALDDRTRADIADANPIRHLVALLTTEGIATTIAATAAAALGNLSVDSSFSRETILRIGGIRALVSLLRSPSLPTVSVATAALGNLATSRTLCRAIWEEGGVLEIARLLEITDDDEEEEEEVEGGKMGGGEGGEGEGEGDEGYGRRSGTTKTTGTPTTPSPRLVRMRSLSSDGGISQAFNLVDDAEIGEEVDEGDGEDDEEESEEGGHSVHMTALDTTAKSRTAREVRLRAAATLSNLAKGGRDLCAAIEAAGAVGPLLAMLSNPTSGVEGVACRAIAAGALGNLSIHPSIAKSIASSSTLLPTLRSMLDRRAEREKAAGVLCGRVGVMLDVKEVDASLLNKLLSVEEDLGVAALSNLSNHPPLHPILISITALPLSERLQLLLRQSSSSTHPLSTPLRSLVHFFANLAATHSPSSSSSSSSSSPSSSTSPLPCPWWKDVVTNMIRLLEHGEGVGEGDVAGEAARGLRNVAVWDDDGGADGDAVEVEWERVVQKCVGFGSNIGNFGGEVLACATNAMMRDTRARARFVGERGIEYTLEAMREASASGKHVVIWHALGALRVAITPLSFSHLDAPENLELVHQVAEAVARIVRAMLQGRGKRGMGRAMDVLSNAATGSVNRATMVWQDAGEEVVQVVLRKGAEIQKRALGALWSMTVCDEAIDTLSKRHDLFHVLQAKQDCEEVQRIKDNLGKAWGAAGGE